MPACHFCRKERPLSKIFGIVRADGMLAVCRPCVAAGVLAAVGYRIRSVLGRCPA
jgi:hypothetical protein